MINERLDREWIAQNSESTSMKLHLERYNFALAHLKNKKVLDIACGTGYGSEILSARNEVIGVDIDSEAIAQARAAAPNINYICSSYQELALPQKIDTIVSLETIEHLPNPSDFIRFCYETMPSGGTLIISAPISYTTDLNTFHISDFTESSFRKLIESKGFRPLDIQLHQKQKMLEKENTSKLSLWEYLLLLKSYLIKPNNIVKRIKDFMQNGWNIKYITVVYKKL
jgi:cyclopropane fatty-acyl-phospholipid synthase-like methyltransferase